MTGITGGTRDGEGCKKQFQRAVNRGTAGRLVMRGVKNEKSHSGRKGRQVEFGRRYTIKSQSG